MQDTERIEKAAEELEIQAEKKTSEENKEEIKEEPEENVTVETVEETTEKETVETVDKTTEEPAGKDVVLLNEETESQEKEVEDNPPACKKKKRWKYRLVIACVCVAAVLVGAYIGLTFLFETHFMFCTTINGKDYSLKSVEDVEADMESIVQNYSLTIVESDGDSEVISGEAVNLRYVQTEELTTLVKAQENSLWFTSLWEKPAYETKITVQYDEELLEEVLEGLACMDSDNQVKSVNAHPEFKDTEFVIVEEVVGTEIQEEVFEEAVENAILAFEDTLVLSEEGCYVQPKYVSTSEKVIEATEKMNSYLKAEITYDLHPDTVVVDAAVIAEWIDVSKNMKVSFNTDKLTAYVDELAKKYDTWGKDREFKAADGEVVTVSGGAYGWLINEAVECEQLMKDIEAGEKITREPVYHSYGIAVEHTDTEWGDTYAEVDLTDQMMYFIQDGEVVLESKVVTGNPNKGNATPQGIYSLTYKTRNAVLRGRRDKNGKPEYETPVAYWMPFNGGIGFHDATWQSSFGGKRYLTNGSHGCINMPKDKAAKLYELIPNKCPVICHY